MNTVCDRDWPEDFEHENGEYMNTCCECKNTFTGHKRRFICKACSTSQGGEAVAAQTRFRLPQNGSPDWSPWHETRVSKSQPAWCIDSQGFEVEYRLLYTHPADQVAEGVPMDAIEAAIWGAFADGAKDYKGCTRERIRELRALLAKSEGVKK